MTKTKYHYLLVTLTLNEIDLNEFRHGGLNITGFSMIDYRNPNTLSLLSDTLQINVPFNNKIHHISVSSFILIVEK